MPSHHDAWLRHQQLRWLQPDGGRWIRPDAARFLPPGADVEKHFRPWPGNTIRTSRACRRAIRTEASGRMVAQEEAASVSLRSRRATTRSTVCNSREIGGRGLGTTKVRHWTSPRRFRSSGQQPVPKERNIFARRQAGWRETAGRPQLRMPGQ